MVFFFYVQHDSSSHQRCSMKKVFLGISQNSQENTCVRVCCNFIKNGTLAQVPYYKFCEISKSTFRVRIIFNVKNVCTYSSNIKLKRYKISFSLLANYSIKTSPHVCVETFVWLSSCSVYFL